MLVKDYCKTCKDDKEFVLKQIIFYVEEKGVDLLLTCTECGWKLTYTPKKAP